MKYSEFVEAADEAKRTLNMAKIMVARLLPYVALYIDEINDYSSAQHISNIKTKLKNFDSRSQVWKNK